LKPPRLCTFLSVCQTRPERRRESVRTLLPW